MSRRISNNGYIIAAWDMGFYTWFIGTMGNDLYNLWISMAICGDLMG